MIEAGGLTAFLAASDVMRTFAPFVLALLAAGVFAGLVAGMFGIGGGFVVVPALAAVFTAFAPDGGDQDRIMHVAVGTSLATILFTSLRAVQAHAKRGAVDFEILKGWTLWVALGVTLGVALADHLDGQALKVIFGVGVLLMGLHFLFPILGRDPPQTESLPRGGVRAALGGGLGAFSALLGIGGGTPAVLIMTMGGVAMHRAVATAAGFGAVIAVPGAIGNMIIGYGEPGLPPGSIGFVNVIALAAIVATSMITAPIGVAAAHSLNAALLKRCFGVYLLFTAGLMLHDAGPFALPGFDRAASVAHAAPPIDPT
ncbi:MAG: sulfite exporter TauE/SafE family protein [Hyphomonadaceae bacterium]|nr:sulfite exporter TauE/SafE family protein [Hyphomonadaceae bacterium]